MARDSSGTFTLPLPAVASGDVIEASWANTTLDDVKVELTDSLSRSGKGNMSAALKVIAGTVSAPGLSFVSEANSGLYRASAADIRMALNSTEAWRVTSAGFRVPADITLAAGNIIPSTAGKGIDFAAQTATAATGAATTAEIFNHYEEGTWTPNLWDDSLSSSESQTYTTQLGWFTRIGRLVTIDLRLVLSSKGSLTGGNTALIGPLPYAATSATNYRANFHVGSADSGVITGFSSMTGQVAAGLNYITLGVWESGVVRDLTVAELSNSAYVYISGSYFV